MTYLMHYSPLMTSLIRSLESRVLTALRDPLQSSRHGESLQWIVAGPTLPPWVDDPSQVERRPERP